MRHFVLDLSLQLQISLSPLANVLVFCINKVGWSYMHSRTGVNNNPIQVNVLNLKKSFHTHDALTKVNKRVNKTRPNSTFLLGNGVEALPLPWLPGCTKIHSLST